MSVKTYFLYVFILLTCWTVFVSFVILSNVHTHQLRSSTRLKPLIPRLSAMAIASDYSAQDGFSWNIMSSKIGSMGRTSNTSYYKLIGSNNAIYRGDFIHLMIVAKDNNGSQRRYGGDIWIAKMYNTDFNFGTTGKVIDHNNGTYSVYFYAGWSGTVTLEILLALQREAITWMKTFHRPQEHRVLWIGIFDDGKRIERTTCYIQREGLWENKCEYPHISALGDTTFLCDPPKYSHCGNLSILTRKRDIKGQDYLKDKKKHEFLFKQPNAMVQIPGTISKIKIIDRDTGQSDYDTFAVPNCRPNLPETLSDGYWLDGHWYSLTCKNSQWSNPSDVQRCLHGKDVYFIGDSTTRELFQIMIEYIGYPVNVTEGNWRDIVDPIEGIYDVRGTEELNYVWTLYDIPHDINLTFRHHALTFHHEIPILRFPFETDVIHRMQRPACDYVVLVSLWAHFTGWTLDSYTDRLHSIKRALEHLRHRCPDTIILIKGSHDRGEQNKYSQYWLLFDMIRIMKEVFSDTNVHFIDTWDMNTAYAASFGSKMKLHMPIRAVKQELEYILSHICPEK
ncbi:NXPE family member 4-like [Saccoglossus kowalevskii]|uniref:NXPE family member 4-like n=1 Tax=Saccoglossus kowalevskii TaxID=10224 RepID=A0ABM0GM72_SACKO|nr:PREDICTED: NXPE family member 4-like [Saccoglossus kowalevskii]